jgi:plastocyanin
MVAGAALLVAACGGSKGGGSADSNKVAPPTANATTPAGTGTTHEVQMVLVGTNGYKFDPADITIKSGDVVVFKGVSGLAHNVAFWPDSIPPAAVPILRAAMPDGTQDLATAMINDGQSVSISFAGAPPGVYKYYCIPHLPMGMKGTITVQ